jgi:hypothetical protein
MDRRFATLVCFIKINIPPRNMRTLLFNRELRTED